MEYDGGRKKFDFIGHALVRGCAVFLICWSCQIAQAEGLPSDKTISYGVNLQGAPITQLLSPHDRAVVLFFTASDCPIANRYVPEIVRLEKEFGPKGVVFWWVYPNPSDTASVVLNHDRDFGVNPQVILDTKQTLVRIGHAYVTPQSAVFLASSGGMKEVYNGRIDDKYLTIGTERPRVSHHDLEIAIAAAVNGDPVPAPGGPPVGCSIVPLK